MPMLNRWTSNKKCETFRRRGQSEVACSTHREARNRRECQTTMDRTQIDEQSTLTGASTKSKEKRKEGLLMDSNEQSTMNNEQSFVEATMMESLEQENRIPTKRCYFRIRLKLRAPHHYSLIVVRQQGLNDNSCQ